MKTKIGFIYADGENFYTPAQTGDFYIVDMWECDKTGKVKDIDNNPCPYPRSTEDLVLMGKSRYNYSYPEWDVKF